MPFRTPSSMLQAAVYLCPLAMLCVFAPAAHASSITYDVTLSPTSGRYGGTGSITLASAPSPYGLVTYSHADGLLQDLTVTIDGKTFSLAGDPWTTVQFLDGQLYKISFDQTVGYSVNRYTLDTSSVYAFYSSNGEVRSAGIITAVPAVDTPVADAPPSASTQTSTTSPTPEPGSVILLATALFAGGLLIFRSSRS